MEKVSVIIPCYNGEKFIDRSIKSIYIQEYPVIELIVVDDGSTDGSKKKILTWEPIFKNKGYELKYVYQDNTGLGGAINKALKFVTGDYISLLDADDEYLSGAIIEKVQYLQQNVDIDVVRSNGWMVKGNSKFLFVNDEKEKALDDVFLALLRGETNNWAGSYMVRAKALFDFYPDREIYRSRFGQNLQFLLPLTYKKRCGFIDKPHMNYIQQPNSLSQTTDKQELLQKSLENAAGYRDIRKYMVELIVTNEIEKGKFIEAIQLGYYKGIMNLANATHNKVLMEQAFNNKLKFENPSLNEKIIYFSLISPYKAVIYKIIRKIQYCIKKFL